MNLETVFERDKTTFSSTITNELVNKKNKFIDTRLLLDKVPRDKQKRGSSILKMGKTFLVFDNKTGEITDWHKPHLTPWSWVMKNVDSCLDVFRKKYFDHNIVKKKHVTIEGFSENGFDILESIKRNPHG